MNIQPKVLVLLATLCLMMAKIPVFAQGKDQSKSENITANNAPFKVIEEELSNGLKVFMAPTKESPTVRTSIVVRAGSQQEPESTTGLAHYLEHLLFKGTDKLGALDYSKEKPLLDEIERQFEQYRSVKDSTSRKQIYKKIDSLSYEASKYAQSSEFTDMLVKMGAFFVNAFTNVNRTAYINKIPSNQLEKWIRLEAERFRNPQFRTFHTELEAVYEEMNIFQDNAYRMTELELLKALFPLGYGGYKHPIGEIGHLKNPSITEIKKFYHNYYVPNNMAIILVGDFNPKSTLKLLESTFGRMNSGTIPKIKKPRNQKLKSSIEKSITTSGPNLVYIGYEFDGYGSKEAIMMEFIEMLMFNGNAGLLDLNFKGKEKIKNISTKPIFYSDYSAHVIYAEPKEGESLQEVKVLILEQLDRLKNGDFPEWLVEATSNELSKRYMQSTSNESGKTNLILNTFINGVTMDENFQIIHQLNAISKKDIIEFAKNHYGNNYALVYHNSGTNINKIDKPEITGLHKNTSKKSEFRDQLETMAENFEITYEPLDFEKDIKEMNLNGGSKLYYVKNTNNSLFNTRLVFNIPQSDVFSPIIKDFLEKSSIENKARNEIDEELFKLGSQIRFFSNLYSLTIEISGLSENYLKSINLLSDLLNKIEANPQLLETTSSSILSASKKERTSSRGKKQQALRYIRYGQDNALSYVVSKEKLEGIQISELVDQINNIFNNHYNVYHYGADKADSVREILNTRLIAHQNITKTAESTIYQFVPSTKDKVYMVDHKSNKAELFFVTKLKPYDKDLEFMSIIFNFYFNRVIFNELREMRGLAYSAYSRFDIPTYGKRNYLFYPIVNTQTDKVLEAAILTKKLIRALPMDEEIYRQVSNKFLKVWKSNRASGSNKLWWFQGGKMRGFDEDPFARNIRLLEKSTYEDFKKFYKEWIKDAAVETLIVGDLDAIEQEKLKQLGEIEVLTIERLFGN